MLAEYTPADVLSRPSGRAAMSGVQALGRLLIDQRRADARRGLRTAGLASGYRGSPLAGLDLYLGRNAAVLAEHDIRLIPGINEELGATVVYGSQLAPQLPDPRYEGVFGLWYGKAPGVDRSGDAFKHGTWMGTTPHGGVLVAAGDDPANKSSSLPSSSVMALAEAYMPVLAPADVADLLRLGRFGYEMSRFTGSWVGFPITTNIADAYDVVELGADLELHIPDFEWEGRAWQPTYKAGVTIPEATALEREVLEGRPAAAEAFAAANRLNRIEGAAGDARIGLIVSGLAYAELREALGRLGLGEEALRRHGVRILRLGMVHPLDRAAVRAFAAGLTDIVVVEDKRAFVETQVRDTLYSAVDRPRVYGKRGPDGGRLVPADGALDADRLIVALSGLLADRLGHEAVDLRDRVLQPRRRSLPLVSVARTPYFCSGCPHNRSTVLPSGSIAGSGIGCHAMTTFMDRSIGFTQMGGEGVTWVGAAPFTNTEHFFQNLGDGTFFHSGSLAIRQAVAAGTTMTFKLLYNGAVAMTGGQHADGDMDPVSLSWSLHAEGVARVVVVADDPSKYPRGARWAPGVTVRHRDDLDAVQEELRATSGVTVLVYDSACAAETRRSRKRGKAPEPPQRVLINESVCEGCGDCGRVSNCLSVEPVETEFGRKRQIEQTSCNKDYSCLLGDCPSFVTVIPAEGVERRPDARVDPEKIPGDLPEPESRTREANLLLVGIGGTGVVTANQVLGTAALLCGLEASALDQTGMSQKAGSVVSHLRISASSKAPTGLIGSGHTDAYLVFDALAGAADPHLGRCDPHRTVAVVSTSEVPPGSVIADPGVEHPAPETLIRRIAERTRGEALVSLDARALAERLFGDNTAANFLVLGAAYQKGLLPLDAEAIERAIELNGVSVERTTQAFRIGRKLVLDGHMAGFDLHGADGGGAPEAEDGRLAEETDLDRVIRIRAQELTAYQNHGYSERYLGVLDRITRAEEAAEPSSRDLTEAVARSLHKLMAYKDEYEVARLHLSADFREEVRQRFGPGAKVSYKLHPPVLRSLGMRRKISLGGRTGWLTFRVLRAMRKVRGTPFDPFGYTKVRRTERLLVVEYVEIVERLVAGLTKDNHQLAVEIAGLPDVIRGYEEIKLAAVEDYREQLGKLLTRFDAPR